MPGFIGNSAKSPKGIVNMWIGTSAGTKQVKNAWVGNSSGVPKLWYQQQGIDLTATTHSHRQINLSWTQVDFTTEYRLYRDGILIYNGPWVATVQNQQLNPDTTYNYSITAIPGGQTDTASATTSSTPIYTYDTGTIYSDSASYNGPGATLGSWALRETNNRLFYGRIDSSRGHQQSGAIFAIPANVRNCYKILSVQCAFRVQYAPNAPDAPGLVIMYNTSWPSTWPGSPGPFAYPSVSGQDTWWSGNEWMDVTASAGEAFRTGGATGFGIAVTSNTVNDYGYMNHLTAPAIGPRLRIVYQVLGT